MESSRWKIVGEVFGVITIAFSILFIISLGTYNQDDPSFNRYLSGAKTVSNKAGIVGASVSDTLAQFSGSMSWLVVAGFLIVGFKLLSGHRVSSLFFFLSGLSLLTSSLSGMTHLIWTKDPVFGASTAGGMMGRFVAEKLIVPWFGVYGSFVALIALVLLSVLLMFRLSIHNMALSSARLVWKMKGVTFALGRLSWPVLKKLGSVRIPLINENEDERIVRERKKRIREKDREDEGGLESADGMIMDMPPPRIVDFSPEDEESPTVIPPPRGKGKKQTPEEVFQQEIFSFDKKEREYEFPPLKLLDAEAKTVVKQSREDLIKSSRILEKKLLDFGIEGRVTQVLPGPVITIFEFEPAPGVKVSRIVSLADDLAMSLRAMSIRVVAPIPGKSVVGIEVPNLSREPVYLKEILSSEEFEESGAKIPLTLGKDVSGKPVVVDLAAIPHLLIAGSTGSGKSVGINGMICSVLYRLTPSDVKFIMIDPKMLELSIYDGIPHLIAPVVTNPKKAANALRWVVTEMERRYALLSEHGVRNIDNFNKRVADLQAGDGKKSKTSKRAIEPDENETAEEPLTKLPYIVVVIDELADLMMVSSKDVEDALARLAQMARAAGIHLIVATQRPSVDVLTGLIKANFPARISYQVRSRVDSRTIIDSMGAEKLLGKGDLLYLPPGAANLGRIQGPFVSDAEIHRVVDFLKGQRRPEYIEDILKAPAEEAGGEGMEEDMDEFYDQAVELVARTRQVSISMIQRRLRIGYNRAARIVEVMEKQGIVGPADGVKAREVLVRPIDDMEPSYN
ncbi:MAG: DNA translocase FtsK 4TM domain-containing protein [Nitrospinae bacterium]|nr:DNA translocase FtsK 4TM domain-containing protein [Nitrospinota bacterium]MBF0634187.1 DNA translocase FtsK 4TM domain-containing protein [Nitrospinota bacterium]